MLSEIENKIIEAKRDAELLSAKINDKEKSIIPLSLKLSQFFFIQDKIITLKIGNKNYCTTNSVLLKYDSIFKDLIKTIDKDDIIEIPNRSSILFDFILEYFRTDKLNFDDLTLNLINNITQECEFYKLYSLQNYIKENYFNKIIIIEAKLSTEFSIDSMSLGSNDINDLSSWRLNGGFCTSNSLIFKLKNISIINSIELANFKTLNKKWNKTKGEGLSILISKDEQNWESIGNIPQGYGDRIIKININSKEAQFIKFGEGIFGIGFLRINGFLKT